MPMGDNADSRLRGNDGRFYGRFGLSGARIIKTRLPCGMGSIGGCRSREYACQDKTRQRSRDIRGRSRNVPSDSRGTVIEALCERYKLPPVVGFPRS